MRQFLLQIPVVQLKIVTQMHVIAHVLPANVPVTHAIVAAILFKVLQGKDYILSKNGINSSVLPEGLTSVLHE